MHLNVLQKSALQRVRFDSRTHLHVIGIHKPSYIVPCALSILNVAIHLLVHELKLLLHPDESIGVLLINYSPTFGPHPCSSFLSTICTGYGFCMWIIKVLRVILSDRLPGPLHNSLDLCHYPTMGCTNLWAWLIFTILEL